MIIGGDGPPPSIDQLISIDDHLADAGIAVMQRPFAAARTWAETSGDMMIALRQEAWFRDAYRKLHPSVPFDAESFLTLCVSARSVSYILKPPLAYGQVLITPMKHVEISEPEVRRLYQAHPSSYWEMSWQAVDCIDLFMALVNYHPKKTLASNMMTTAVHQMTASARQLVACEVDASLPQGMAMAVELAGKSILSAQGMPEKALRRLGHDLCAITKTVSEFISPPVDSEVKAVTEMLPKYVSVRYDAPNQTIANAQEQYRRSLFVIADFLRRTNHDQMYWKFINGTSLPKRIW